MDQDDEQPVAADIFKESILIRGEILSIGAQLNRMAAYTEQLDLDTVRRIRRQMAACCAAITTSLDNRLG